MQSTLTVRILFVSEPWLRNIINGTKTVSGRAGSADKFTPWIGSVVRFNNDKHSVRVKIISIRHYPDLTSYLNGEGWQNVAPHLKSFDEAKTAYSAFYAGGETEIISRGGFCGIVIEKIGVYPKKSARSF